MDLETSVNYGLRITKQEKLNYYKAMARDPQFIYLHNPHKFDDRFLEKTRSCDTYEEAYQAVEEEYRKAFRTTKYKNYESYRKARSRRIKDKAKANN